MADPLLQHAQTIRDLGRRLLSVERRFPELIARMVRNFVELEDVKSRIVEHEPLTPGDVWGINDDEQWDIITPEGGGGGTGAWASIAVTGLYDGDSVSAVETLWTGFSSSAWELTVASGSATTIGLSINATTAGIYDVFASAMVTVGGGSGSPMVLPGHHHLTNRNWMIEGDVDDCRPGLDAMDVGDGGSAASLMLPLSDDVGSLGVSMDLNTGGADEIRWLLQVGLRHPFPVLPGTCGD